MFSAFFQTECTTSCRLTSDILIHNIFNRNMLS